MITKDTPGICALCFVVALVMGYCIAQHDQYRDYDSHHHVIKDSLEYCWVYCPQTGKIAIFNKEGEIITYYYK